MVNNDLKIITIYDDELLDIGYYRITLPLVAPRIEVDFHGTVVGEIMMRNG